MTCAVCFFSEKFQKNLKKSTFGVGQFERKLTQYKIKFIHELKNIESVAYCHCSFNLKSPELISWTDELVASWQNSLAEIENALDGLIAVYNSFLRSSQKNATDLLWKFVADNKILSHVASQTDFAGLFFRARIKGSFNESEIKEYFHIPFSKRHLVGNQRFSVSGQPMLYFASSFLAATKELNSTPEKLAVSAFIPNYSEFYNSRILSLKNHVSEVIENVLPGLIEAGVQINFNDRNVAPSASFVKSDIYRNVLMNLCTFPVENRGAFVEEYVLPQMLTTALLENGFEGILFPSTKDYSEIDGHHRFSSHHINLGLFVPYDDTNDYSAGMLNRFLTTIYKKNGLPPTIDEIFVKAREIGEFNKASSVPEQNNDYILAMVKIKLYFEYLATSTLNGIPYFETEIGEVERTLAMRMLERLASLLK
jgi:hypothetical protein